MFINSEKEFATVQIIVDYNYFKKVITDKMDIGKILLYSKGCMEIEGVNPTFSTMTLFKGVGEQANDFSFRANIADAAQRLGINVEYKEYPMKTIGDSSEISESGVDGMLMYQLLKNDVAGKTVLLIANDEDFLPAINAVENMTLFYLSASRFKSNLFNALRPHNKIVLDPDIANVVFSNRKLKCNISGISKDTDWFALKLFITLPHGILVRENKTKDSVFLQVSAQFDEREWNIETLEKHRGRECFIEFAYERVGKNFQNGKPKFEWCAKNLEF